MSQPEEKRVPTPPGESSRLDLAKSPDDNLRWALGALNLVENRLKSEKRKDDGVALHNLRTAIGCIEDSRKLSASSETQPNLYPEMAKPSAPSATPRTFSDFIRNAPPEEKEKVYTEVMAKASERQRIPDKHLRLVSDLRKNAALFGLPLKDIALDAATRIEQLERELASATDHYRLANANQELQAACIRAHKEREAQVSATQPPAWSPTEATSLFQRLEKRGLILPAGILPRLRFIATAAEKGIDPEPSRSVTEDATFLVALLEEMLPPAVPVCFSDGGADANAKS